MNCLDDQPPAWCAVGSDGGGSLEEGSVTIENDIDGEAELMGDMDAQVLLGTGQTSMLQGWATMTPLMKYLIVRDMNSFLTGSGPNLYIPLMLTLVLFANYAFDAFRYKTNYTTKGGKEVDYYAAGVFEDEYNWWKISDMVHTYSNVLMWGLASAT